MMNFQVARGPLLEAGVAALGNQHLTIWATPIKFSEHRTRRDEVIDLRHLDQRHSKYVPPSY